MGGMYNNYVFVSVMCAGVFARIPLTAPRWSRLHP